MKKSTKVELVSAVAMLLVAAIMMTSASFAWYTLSTTPEVSGVEMELGVSKNFEIARADTGLSNDIIAEVTSNDAISQHTWGAKVTSFGSVESKITYGTHVYNSQICQIGYDETGRTNGTYVPFTATTYGAMANGAMAVSANVSYGGIDVEKNIAVGYGVWLRSNQTVTSLQAIVNTDDAWISTNGGVDTAKTFTDKNGNTVQVKDMISVTVYVLNGQAGSASEWQTQLAAADKLESNTLKQLTSPKDANQQFLAVIMVSVDGEYLYAKDYVETNGASFGGFKITFSTPSVPANN